MPNSSDPPLRLNELDSPRRPNLRSPFADVFNNFWASFSTPSANPNDTLNSSPTRNRPETRQPKETKRNPTPLVSTPFLSTPFDKAVPTLEASTTSLQNSISSKLNSIKEKATSATNSTTYYLSDLVSFLTRQFIAIPLVCFVGSIHQIKYSDDIWGKLCKFALNRNNTALYKYRQRVKRIFIMFILAFGILFNFSLSYRLNHKLTNELQELTVSMQSYMNEYQSSILGIISNIQQQINQPIKASEQAKPFVKKQLSPNIAHLFKIIDISDPLIVYPGNVLGRLGLMWQYASYSPLVLLEDGIAVLGKNYCTKDSTLSVRIAALTDVSAKYLSIRWPKAGTITVNKPTNYTIENVVLHYSVNSTYEDVEIFQIMENKKILLRFHYNEQGENCAYKIGFHMEYH
eukprot:NODE_107_length_19843_cov_0.502077.p6 type:complete len:403 gc:universal NODE_107_length_19843_cov_0.502077:1813-3021(+)